MKRILIGIILATAAIGTGTAGANTLDPQLVVTGNVDVPAGHKVGDIVIFNGPTRVSGTVQGSVVSFDGPVLVSGRVNGDVNAFNGRIVLSSSAVVTGDLNYAEKSPKISPGAKVLGDRSKLEIEDYTALGFAARAALWIGASVSTLLLGLLLLLLAPRGLDAAHIAMKRRGGIAVLWGFLLLIGIPLLGVIALVTLVGIPFGIGVLLATLPLYALGYTLGAWLLGRALIKPPKARIGAFVIGWVILRALSIIPFVDGLTWLIATILGLGALIVAAWQARGKDPIVPSPTPPTTSAAGV